MPTPTTWSDDVDVAAPSGTAASVAAEKPLPARQEITVDERTKRVIEFSRNEQGQVVRTIRTFRLETRKTNANKAVQARREWSKFGEASKSNAESTTSVAEDVYLVLKSKQDGDGSGAAEDNDMKKKLANRAVQCRLCKGEHFTSKCPFKDQVGALEMPPMDDESANKGSASQAAAAASGAGADSGKYVPPSMRGGGAHSGPGSSMRDRERDDTCSIRITNLAEDTVEDDLRSLCKSCGPITRIYLAKDKETGMAKGFAFVNFVRREDAAKAITVLNGHGFGHLILHVEWAKNPNT